MSRRDELADAAIRVLAREGARGLTHRAVDTAAGLAEGTCSYYFRTRAALWQACVEREAARSLEELPAGADVPGTPEDLVDVALATVERWLADDRERLRAHWELALEATRRPELRDAALAAGVPVREQVTAMLAGLGIAEPQRRTRDLVACLDGLAFDQLTGVAPRDSRALRAAITDVVAGFTR
jgi:DNA-binding transcriptional regulator YbjK